MHVSENPGKTKESCAINTELSNKEPSEWNSWKWINSDFDKKNQKYVYFLLIYLYIYYNLN